MRAGELPEARKQHRSLGRRDVPNLVARIAEGAKEIRLAAAAFRQVVTGADARHLRAARLAPGHFAPTLARDMENKPRRAWIGHVEDGRAVLFHRAGERVDAAAAMRADVRDPALALALDGRLIGAAASEIVKADAAQVVRFVLRRGAGGEQSGNEKKRGALTRPGRTTDHSGYGRPSAARMRNLA